MHGEIDHDNQILRIEGEKNVYVTNEPQLALNKRIKYCLALYHETQRAITYPDMKMKIEEAKELEMDESELLDLLDFDDDMWKVALDHLLNLFLIEFY